MFDDPELRRIAELLVCQREGRLADAEHEELELYLDQQPELVEQARAQLGALVLPTPTGASEIDRAWLERVHGDRALTQAGQTRRTRLERGLGVGLVAGGSMLALGGTSLGLAAILAGVALLLVSFIRVRLTTRDPYDQIEQ